MGIDGIEQVPKIAGYVMLVVIGFVGTVLLIAFIVDAAVRRVF